MKIVVFGIANKTSVKKYKKFAQEILFQHNKKRLLDNSKTLNIIFVDDAYIKKLNRQFLGRNRPTDVLAFPIKTEKITTNDTNTSNNTNKNQFSIRKIRLISDIRGKKILCPSCVIPRSENKVWAEIYISLDRAQEQAKELKITTSKEIGNLIKHGILHLLGYSHNGMKRLED
jgi:probable rRNA maturation factor